jgi:predicted RNA-binding Zn-ribbon protein involved in translation (DUF1610 family)
MTICFTPSGHVTHEECPICGRLNVKVEHGHRTRLQPDQKPQNIGLAEEWHCPDCGTRTVIVGFDCPHCNAEPVDGQLTVTSCPYCDQPIEFLDHYRLTIVKHRFELDSDFNPKPEEFSEYIPHDDPSEKFVCPNCGVALCKTFQQATEFLRGNPQYRRY